MGKESFQKNLKKTRWKKNKEVERWWTTGEMMQKTGLLAKLSWDKKQEASRQSMEIEIEIKIVELQHQFFNFSKRKQKEIGKYLYIPYEAFLHHIWN